VPTAARRLLAKFALVFVSEGLRWRNNFRRLDSADSLLHHICRAIDCPGRLPPAQIIAIRPHHEYP
jgi:hypothetical protein